MNDQQRTGSSTLDELRKRMPPPMLYHFTSSAGLIGIADTETMFATHLAYLNDTAERQYGLGLFQAAITEIQAESGKSANEHDFLEKLRNATALLINGPQTYVTSFATAETLAMFRMYCPPDDGYCLGFSRQRLSLMASDQGFNLQQCIYNQATQEIIVRELIEAQLDVFRRLPRPHDFFVEQEILDFRQVLGASYLPLFKHPSFEAEEEWRLILTVSKNNYHRYKTLFRKGIRGVTP